MNATVRVLLRDRLRDARDMLKNYQQARVKAVSEVARWDEYIKAQQEIIDGIEAEFAGEAA